MGAVIDDGPEFSMAANNDTRDSTENRRQLLGEVRRIVVKVGTNVLTRDSGELAMGRTHSLIEDIVDVHRARHQVIVVSSGAVAMGMERLGLNTKPSSLPDLQACAAVGQSRLMSVYEQAFGRSGIATAQILLTEYDFADRERYLNLRNTMERLLADGVIPIVNENDTVSTSEIESLAPDGGEKGRPYGERVFGDNDRLSAQVMSKLDAELLVLFTDVDGLFTDYSDGGSDRPLSLVKSITPEVEAMAQRGNARGRGGMVSKLQSIRIALAAGGLAIIASGLRPRLLQSVLRGEDVGTLFLPERRLTSSKRWLAYASLPAGRVVVNTGAEEALVERRSSLLFAGVTQIEGDFRQGDVVVLSTEAGREIGKGKTNYAAADALPLLGKRSDEIAATHSKQAEFIHSDNIVILI